MGQYWPQKTLIYLSFFLSLSLSGSLSLSLYICIIYMYIFLSFSLSLSVYLYIHMCIFLSLSLWWKHSIFFPKKTIITLIETLLSYSLQWVSQMEYNYLLTTLHGQWNYVRLANGSHEHSIEERISTCSNKEKIPHYYSFQLSQIYFHSMPTINYKGIKHTYLNYDAIPNCLRNRTV